MIGRLSGRIAYRAADHVILDVGGVGYVVHCSERTLAALGGAGEAAQLWTDLLVREDLLQLFGFPTLLEKEWHRLLTTVQGVGAKASMAILGTLGPDGVGRAIALGDWASIRAAPGVGPKLAQRVANELKDKAPAVMALGGIDAGAAPMVPASVGGEVVEPSAPSTPGGGAGAQSEALSALQNLGYAPADASRAVAEAAGEGAEDTAGMIRAALKRLAPA
ncbi:Holliday junction DNA helicase subunit RuvA [Hasllibacter halocynthiae]|uniref:Holliday junction branch migration complex subunit RuvA n=1 Tax=Hasllibacter halocynthiae TaxID=595589 RepID=A0A2T0X9N3_9RHOB|nr:Holliday junction branch migration protein RuvA [Hasllibacter halocynthiae]PRY95646.1 Holliday junction DNA helicase subunit RuvA [Hasllibacter halocynthiae]